MKANTLGVTESDLYGERPSRARLSRCHVSASELRRASGPFGLVACMATFGIPREAVADEEPGPELEYQAVARTEEAPNAMFSLSAVFGYKQNVLSTGREFGMGGAVRGGYTFGFPIYTGAYVSAHMGDETHRVLSLGFEVGYDIELGKPLLRPEARFGMLRAKTGEDGGEKFSSPVAGLGVRFIFPSNTSFFSVELDAESSLKSAIRGSIAYTITGAGAYVGGGLYF